MLIDKNSITPVLNAHKELTDAIFNLSTELETTAAQTIQNTKKTLAGKSNTHWVVRTQELNQIQR